MIAKYAVCAVVVAQATLAFAQSPAPPLPQGEPPSHPAMATSSFKIPTFPVHKFVPSGDSRSIAFLAALNPDCSPRGDIIAKLQKAPKHGTLNIVKSEGFTSFDAKNQQSVCNSQKNNGLRLDYKSETTYSGEDDFDILLLYPDGSAAILNFDVNVMKIDD